jgi:N-acetyl-anhydromuramyl-L-alanine amidase AmpD
MFRRNFMEAKVDLSIIKIPSKYHRHRPGDVDTLVVHAMAEWVMDDNGEYHYCTDWLNILELSVHAYCLPDGRIVESVDPGRVAYHAGGYNNRSIGMEFIIPGGHNYDTFLEQMANTENPPYSVEQYAAGGLWFRQIADRFGLTYQNIRSHHQLDPDRKLDPGDAFSWAAFQAHFESLH